MRVIRKLAKALQILFSNPKIFYEKLALFLKIYSPKPHSPFIAKIKDISFEMDLNYDPDILDMYYGQYQPSTIKLMKKFLKKGDIFLDVGANIGYISAVGMSLVGKEGEVHCFEPVPEYYGKLKRLRELNKGYQFILNECAAGEKDGEAVIAIPKASPAGSEKESKETGALGWSSLVFNSTEEDWKIHDYLKVRLRSIDSYIEEKKIERISMIKIDAEAYDFLVLKGMSKCLSRGKNKPIILCELFPMKLPELGYSMKDFLDFSVKHHYKVFDEDNFVEIKKHDDIKNRLDLVLLPFDMDIN